jgi:hypothetical protein
MAENPEQTVPDGEDTIAQFKLIIQEQRKKQENLRYVHQFLTSPQFIDMRDAKMVVSDPPEVIAQRKLDLDYRITVLTSLVGMLQEERAALDRTHSSQVPPEAEPEGPEPGDLFEASEPGTEAQVEVASEPVQDAPALSAQMEPEASKAAQAAERKARRERKKAALQDQPAAASVSASAKSAKGGA